MAQINPNHNQIVEYKLVEPFELYNKLQCSFNEMIVIDIRPFDIWKKCHIINSINIPSNMNLSNDKIIELIRTCQNKKDKFPNGYSYYIITDNKANYKQFINLLSTLTHQNIHKTIHFYCLKISFNNWYNNYTYLCMPDMLNIDNAVLSVVNTKIYTQTNDNDIKNDIDNDMDIYKQLLTITSSDLIWYQRYPAAIIPNKMYLGGVIHAKLSNVMIKLNIGYILNVTKYEQCYFKNDPNYNIKYHQIKINDHTNENIKQYFADAFEFIDESIASNKSILIHCSAGVSRSSTIVIGYLISRKNMGYMEAYRHVKQQRQIIEPNDGFVEQLKELETELINEKHKSILSNCIVQ